MNKEEFFAYKAQLIKTMEYQLSISKVYNKPLSDYCSEAIIEQIVIRDDVDEEDLRYLMSRVQELMLKSGTRMVMAGSTRPSGRYDYFSYITYSFHSVGVKADIENYQIEDKMKDWVKSKLGIQSHHYLECKVMQLFKDGSIEWEQVVEAHQGDCSI